MSTSPLPDALVVPPLRPDRPARPGRRALRFAALAALLVPSAYYAGRVLTGNFGTVAPGRVYRAGQMRADDLAKVVHRYGIKTVLNLRGSHPEADWYRAERAAVLGRGATQIDVALSSCEWMSRKQAGALLDVLETADRPMLIHCFNGSERTGLVSAYAELLRPGATLTEARAQFSLRYLFVRAGNGVVMPEHVERYEAWLKDHDLVHTPDRFRRWVRREFRPGKPSREDWPYDPYPLVVISRPPK